MSLIEESALRDALRAVLDERARIPEPDHRAHHAWVQQQIERDHARAEFWRGLAAKSLPAIVWTGLAGLLGWIWHTVRTHITWS